MKPAKRIIINFPTNIGDALLTLPAVDRVKGNFREAEITAIVSPKTEKLLSANTFIDKSILFDKKWRGIDKLRFCLKLRGKFDLLVDFKNSMLPVFLQVKRHTPLIRRFSKNQHSKDRYLELVKKIAPKPVNEKSSFIALREKDWGLSDQKKYLFLAPFSRSIKKEYPRKSLEKVVERLNSKYTFVLLGSEQDRRKINRSLLDKVEINLTGKTEITDLFYLLKRYAHCLFSVDSGIMHIASYLNLPVIGLFGPTDPALYGPYAANSLVLQRKDLDCLACQKGECSRNGECMDIDFEKVTSAIEKLTKLL